MVEDPARGRRRPVPVPARVDGRSLRLARRGRRLHRGHPVPAQLALCSEQGGLRPSGTRVVSYVRPARGDDQLLEQLRPPAVSREAHPAHDPHGPGGRAAAGLRHRRECAGLAVRRGPRGRAPHRAAQRARRARPTTSGVGPSGGTSTWCARSVAFWTGSPPTPPSAVASRSSGSSPTGPGTTSATPWTSRRSHTELGWSPARTFDSGLERTVHWYLDNHRWSERVLSGAYRGERLGLREAAR